MKLSVCENRKIPCSHEQRKALKAFEALLVVWIQTEDATEGDEITMKAMQMEFEARYRYAAVV